MKPINPNDLNGRRFASRQARTCGRILALMVVMTLGPVAHAAFGGARSDSTAGTIWWVVFDSPENCANGIGGCGLDDLGDPAVNASVLHATGHVIPPDGYATFVASLHETPGTTVAPLFGPGLVDAEGAEIHAVVRWHGPVINCRVTRFAKPSYPTHARHLGVEGTVTLRVLVNDSGTVDTVEVEETVSLLEKTAVRAARKSTYSAPGWCRLRIPFTFEPS